MPDDGAEAKAAAKAERAEARAAAKAERREGLQAKREARMAARAAKRAAAEQPTEPEVDEGDGTERPIAVAAKLQQDAEDAERQQQEAQNSREWAAQARREAAEARKAKKAEAAIAKRKAREDAAAAKFKTDAEREKDRELAAAEKAAADAEREKQRELAAAEKAAADAEREKQREESAAAKAAAKRARDEAKAAARQASRQSTSVQRADDDHIVEAPREPKKSLIERLTPARAGSSSDGEGENAPSNVLSTIAVVVGALGFVFSVVLAIGAFMVALNPQDDGGLFNLVSNICDALVGPLRGLFSFSGANGESKEALVAWGLGALGYLVIGLVAQSMLRSQTEDD